MRFERKIEDLITLFNNRKYEKLIFETESNFNDNEINSQVLMILGLARMKSPNRNFKDVLLAIKNFKKGYILEKKTKIGLECLVYYLYGVNEKAKQENSLSLDEYEETKKFFLEAKSTFNYNEKLYHAISLLNLNTTNVDFRQNVLKELIDKDFYKEKTLVFEYIYNNNLRYNWSQKEFFNFTNNIKEKLQFINLPKIQQIKKKKLKLVSFHQILFQIIQSHIS